MKVGGKRDEEQSKDDGQKMVDKERETRIERKRMRSKIVSKFRLIEEDNKKDEKVH